MPPITPDDDPRLKKLDSELRVARTEYKRDYNPNPSQATENMNMGAKAGVELVGAVIAGGVIGYGIDHYFETKPIFFLFFLILGVITGFYNIYKITTNFGTSVGFRGLKNPSKPVKQTPTHMNASDDNKQK